MCSMCSLDKELGRPSHKDKKRAMAEDLPVQRRAKRRVRKSWAIWSKWIGYKRSWASSPPKWSVLKRYETETGREQALAKFEKDPYWSKYYVFRREDPQ